MTTETRKYLIRKNGVTTFLGRNDSEENYDDVETVKTIRILRADEGKTFFENGIDRGNEIWLFPGKTAADYSEKDVPEEQEEEETI